MDFFGINGWEGVVLLLLALFIFGDRLPKMIVDAVAQVRRLLELAHTATGDLGRELGVDVSLEDLHPKTLLRKHLLSEDDERALRQPLQDLYRDVRADLGGVRADVDQIHTDLRSASVSAVSGAEPAGRSVREPGHPVGTSAYVLDEDAT